MTVRIEARNNNCVFEISKNIIFACTFTQAAQLRNYTLACAQIHYSEK